MRTIRPFKNLSTERVVDDMARTNDVTVKKFTRSQPSRQPYSEPMKLDVAPDVELKSTPTPDLHSALHAVGSELLKAGHEPASMASIGFAFRDIASRIAPKVSPKSPSAPEIGQDRSGLFGSPSPDKEAM
jgi:hypothetical protein